MPPRRATTAKPVPPAPAPAEHPPVGTVEEARLTPGAQAARERLSLQFATHEYMGQDPTRQEQEDFRTDFLQERVQMFLGFLGDKAEGYNAYWLERLENDLHGVAREYGWR